MLCVCNKRVCVFVRFFELLCKAVRLVFSCQTSAIAFPFIPIPWKNGVVSSPREVDFQKGWGGKGKTTRGRSKAGLSKTVRQERTRSRLFAKWNILEKVRVSLKLFLSRITRVNKWRGKSEAVGKGRVSRNILTRFNFFYYFSKTRSLAYFRI